jgi:hypothetical protein
MKLRSTDQVAAEKQHMFNCAELLLEIFFFQSRAQCGLFSAISAIVSSKETNLGWDVFMRGSGTYKEKERQKAVLSGTMVVGLAVNCGMLPWLFKEHLPVHLSQSVYSGQASRHIQHLPYL